MRALRPAAPAPWVAEVAVRRRTRERARVQEHHPAIPVWRSDDRQVGAQQVDQRQVDERVTVVLVTTDRRDEVVATLARLRQLPEAPHVIVIDNASADGTAAAVRAQHPWVELFVLDRNAGAIARNLGVRVAETPYVAFNDDDTWWEPGSLAAAADLLDRHGDVAVVTATILVEPAGIEDPIVEDMRISPLPDEPGLPGAPLLSILAGASVVRRDAFLEVGGFEPKLLIGGEEELFATDLASAGWALRHVPSLRVHHDASVVRDPHLRRIQGLRNTLWFQWLRRPAWQALRRSIATIRGAPQDRVTWRGVFAAVAGLPWVLRERRVVPEEVADGLALLDDQQLRSRARRYVS